MTNNNYLAKLIEIRNYLKSWLERAKRVLSVIPFVQRAIDHLDWQIDAISSRPEEAEEIPFVSQNLYILDELDNLQTALPLPPNIDTRYISSFSDTGMTTGSATVFEHIIRVGDLNTPEAVRYSREFTKRYLTIQIQYDQKDEVRQLIERLGNPGTLQRFDEAYETYSSNKAGFSPRTAAANSMRNLLEGIKGDLWKLAKKHNKENMTWKKMSERLAKNGIAGLEYTTLLSHEEVRSSLLARLGSVLHDWEGESVTNLNYIWIQLLDHLFSILKAINIPINLQ